MRGADRNQRPAGGVGGSGGYRAARGAAHFSRMFRLNRLWITVATAVLSAAVAPTSVAAQASTSSADSATIVAVANRFIAAMAAQDTAYLRAASLPSARWVAMSVPTPEGATPRIRGLDQAIGDIARRSARWSGWLIDPAVVVTGPLAVLHAPFGAVTDGSAPYCGEDHYVFVRTGGRWLVSDLYYTIQTVGCAPDRLRPRPSGS